ncbi:4358_t:CDS:2 [Cetraspora pellucida]|uniref:4358_t:CDS:1 n=1 Tax=Cetraspora pellucida TaxID=1433469 RepID=A0A9N9ALU0_9GLOM|nr:4358_t:CDS:2 [Cetraspora pellucida]
MSRKTPKKFAIQDSGLSNYTTKLMNNHLISHPQPRPDIYLLRSFCASMGVVEKKPKL